LPDLSKLLELAGNLPGFNRLLEKLEEEKSDALVVLDAARPYLVAAKRVHEQLLDWYPSGDVLLLPESDTLPYERLASDVATEIERVRVLSSLAGRVSSNSADSSPFVVVSATALMGKLPDAGVFSSLCHTVELGTSIDPLVLLRRWQSMGYRLEDVVEVPGAMSRRGGIVDVFPPASRRPVRLEFFGNTIDSIRFFDPATQRSVDRVTSIAIGPAAELLAPRTMERRTLEKALKLDLTGCTDDIKQQFRRDIAMFLEGQAPPQVQFYAPLFNNGSLLDYISSDALIITDDMSSIMQTLDDLDAEARLMRSEKLERGELPGDFPGPYFNREELQSMFNGRQTLELADWGEGDRLDFISAPGYAGRLKAFLHRARQLLNERKRVIIVSHQASRLSELLVDEDVTATPVESVEHAPGPGSLVLVQGSLPEGWVMNGDAHLFTDSEIFGFVKQRRFTGRRPAPRHKLIDEIRTDDYVVHVEHGIGKFTGVVMLNTAGSDKEYLALQYAAGDVLYVPTDQIDRVSRYIGAGDRTPVLNRLGTQEWNRTRRNAKEAAGLLAHGLLELYASRQVVTGYSFSRDTLWQQEMEAAFPYVETPDQLEAQADVKQDMEKPRPMDRLVCGDVGYGKTEVAIRAAFKAVMDGKQVAVLVPTTVLAQQHYSTFSERLEAFPLRVESLSRFRSPSEQSNVVAGLANGSVDICIGTHRLIQKDVSFKDLGLLIIDEEQRFGVNHKEYLKQMRSEVDVLTLSATPIPRTLHMSLVGVRDMSTMETPPEERLPVKTYVAEYNDRLVREVILRELERNGQVFFVHNRVQSIGMVAENLRQLVPEAIVAVGHGQMPEERLENVMNDFVRGKADVLVCTTIIESGLDMPNVNTIIVNRADKLGLTQLYQLRGRVGRGANLAYAYFLYDKGRELTPVARARLRTIYEATELGAGFGIAMKDLEIRGAGTLLGPRQSGHITAIGFNLYCRLLAEAVEEQKALRDGRPKPPPKLPAPAIDLPLDAYVPEYYVEDVATRMELYRTLSDIESSGKIDDITREYTDRFGTPPTEVENLFYAVRIKALAARAGIESVTTEEGMIVIRRFQGLPFDREMLSGLLRDGIEVGRTQIRLDYKKFFRKWKQVLEEVVEALTRDGRILSKDYGYVR
jgi:transcription-repair coupling factor (superfamily II helicase)